MATKAKKIRLDFSKVEERSGWNTKHIDEGLYPMTIASVEETEAQDGTDMLVFALVPTSSKIKTRRFPFYCKLQQNQLWKLRDLFVAAALVHVGDQPRPHSSRLASQGPAQGQRVSP